MANASVSSVTTKAGTSTVRSLGPSFARSASVRAFFATMKKRLRSFSLEFFSRNSRIGSRTASTPFSISAVVSSLPEGLLSSGAARSKMR